jgi:hypothetical protein
MSSNLQFHVTGDTTLVQSNGGYKYGFITRMPDSDRWVTVSPKLASLDDRTFFSFAAALESIVPS